MTNPLTPEEAASRLRMHKETLLRKVRTSPDKAPPAIWTGTRWLFPAAGLEAWLAKRAQPRAAAQQPKKTGRPRRKAAPVLWMQPNNERM